MSAASPSYDVLMVSDLRFPGGTSHSIVEEIRAQEAAGWSTGLLHVNGPLISLLKPLNPQIRECVDSGAASLLIDGSPVQAAIVVVRHPAVLECVDQLSRIRTDRVLVVANAGPWDVDGSVVYKPARIAERVREHFGVEATWAPIGPQVRAQIEQEVSPEHLLETDWVNVIDVDAWATERDGWAADRPVIGRHSRPSPQKWPRDPAVLRQVYPTDGSWQVHMLGGVDPAAQVLGQVPGPWSVHEFGAMSVPEFLAGLDFFVYYHDPDWVEAFGRTILEAVASGIPAILPPHFEPLFGPAALYAQPHEVCELVEALRADRPRYEAHARQAQQVARERFGHEQHRQRLAALIGSPQESPPHDHYDGSDAKRQRHTAGSSASQAPATTDAPGPTPSAAPALMRSDGPRVLLMSSNGAGMGHLTRLLSYAKHLDGRAHVHFLSLSQAVGVVGQMGHTYEYLPSAPTLHMPTYRWRDLYISRVRETLERFRPDVVVYDGTWPYNGTQEIQEAHPHTRWIWSRRGMWRPGKSAEQIEKASWFTSVMEPGDLASAYDHGATAGAPAHRLGPVTLLDPDEVDDSATARATLGLPADAPTALISLGAGTINDTRGDVGAAVQALRGLGVHVCVTKPEIAQSGPDDPGVHVVQEYPLSRRYAAFDLMVSASGYNSFHEGLRMQVPCLFVPNQATSLDDQEGRARFAADQGWAHAADKLTVETATPLLEDLLDRGPSMVAGAAEADPGNGARSAAAHILEVVS